MANKELDLNKIARELNKAAQSFTQVAKQISGIRGKVTVGDVSLSPKECFNALGMHTKGNKYTAQDIFSAWSERLKEGEATHTNTTESEWRAPQIVKSLALTAKIEGKKYILHDVDDKSVFKVKRLCRVCKAADKRKGSTDVIVTANVVLTGLVQSMRIDKTMSELAKSEAEAMALQKACVNVGTKELPVWQPVRRDDNLEWVFDVPTNKVDVDVTPMAQKSQKTA